MRGRVVAMVGALSLAACSPGGDPLPTEQDALTFFDQVVEVAANGTTDELCALGSSNCERFIADAGPRPADDPTVIGTRTVEPTTTGDTRTVGGVIIEICGENEGEVYYTETLVFRQDGELRAAEPVYWSGFRVAEDATVGGPVENPESICSSA